MASAARSEVGRPTKRAKYNHDVDFAKHFSVEGRSRQYPSLRKIICQFSGADNVVPMHGGLPPSDSFPLSSMLLRLRNGQSVNIVDDKKVCLPRAASHLPKQPTSEVLTSTVLQVASAQQYCTTVQGYPALHTWCEGHMKAMHSLPGQHEVLLTNGSNHTFEVHLSREFVTPVSVPINKQCSRQKRVDADYCLKQTLLCFCSLQSLCM